MIRHGLLPTDAFELARETFLTRAQRFPILIANLARFLSRRLSGRSGLSGRARRPGTWRYFHLADCFIRAGAEAAEAALPRLAALARPQKEIP